MIAAILSKGWHWKNDVLSGLTVALALIPEAIAFSFVAHVDPIVGLYSAFTVGLITAVFGGRPGMISGATGAVAVVFAPLVIQQTAQHGMDVALRHLFLAVIIMGLIQLVFGICRWGKFVRLIPHPVMLGFVNGLAIVIFKSQFAQFMIGTGDQARLMPLNDLMVMSILIGITMGIIYILPKMTTAIPATLVAIGAVTVLGGILNSQGVDVRTVLDFVQNLDPSKTTLQATLPTFFWPVISLDMVKTVMPYAILAALVGLVESLMTLTLVDELTETRGRGNKESIGQGLANVVSGLFGGMGGCAMIGQSMINIRSGGRGRMSGISASIFMILFLFVGFRLVESIPLGALIGVMFMVAIATFEWSSIRVMRHIPRSDTVVIVLVSAVTVMVDLAVAVFIGVLVSALIFAWEQGKKMRHTITTTDEGHRVYELDGQLFFGSVLSFKHIFDVKNDPDDVIIDFSQARVYDFSGVEAIKNVSDRYNKYNKRLHLLNLSEECLRLLGSMSNVVQVSVIDNRRWRIATDALG